LLPEEGRQVQRQSALGSNRIANESSEEVEKLEVSGVVRRRIECPTISVFPMVVPVVGGLDQKRKESRLGFLAEVAETFSVRAAGVNTALCHEIHVPGPTIHVVLPHALEVASLHLLPDLPKD